MLYSIWPYSKGSPFSGSSISDSSSWKLLHSSLSLAGSSIFYDFINFPSHFLYKGALLECSRYDIFSVYSTNFKVYLNLFSMLFVFSTAISRNSFSLILKKEARHGPALGVTPVFTPSKPYNSKSLFVFIQQIYFVCE